MASSESRIGPHLLIAGAVLIAAVIRLYGLSGQLIVSDEWHGLHAAARASYGELFRLLTAGATSIPLNLYYELLLNTVGWSEWSVRGPSFAAGVATVAVVPYLLRGILGTRVAVLSGYLLAISPLLVFVSRYGRP